MENNEQKNFSGITLIICAVALLVMALICFVLVSSAGVFQPIQNGFSGVNTHLSVNLVNQQNFAFQLLNFKL